MFSITVLVIIIKLQMPNRAQVINFSTNRQKKRNYISFQLLVCGCRANCTTFVDDTMAQSGSTSKKEIKIHVFAFVESTPERRNIVHSNKIC